MIYYSNQLPTIKDWYQGFSKGIIIPPVFLSGYSKSKNEYMQKDFGNCQMGLLRTIDVTDFIYKGNNAIGLYICIMFALLVILGLLARQISIIFFGVDKTKDESWFFVLLSIILWLMGILIMLFCFNDPGIVLINREVLNKFVVLVALNRKFTNNEKSKKSNNYLVEIVNNIMNQISKKETSKVLKLLKSSKDFMRFCKNILDNNDYVIIKDIMDNNIPNDIQF